MIPLNYLLLDFQILQYLTSEIKELLYCSLQKTLSTLENEKQGFFSEMRKAALGE